MYYIGVDPGQMTGIAILNDSNYCFSCAYQTKAHAMKDGGWRVGVEIGDEVRETIDKARLRFYEICVETPVPGPSILVYGAQMEMIGAFLASFRGVHPIHLVHPVTVKRSLVGRGNANKPMMAEALETLGIKVTGNKKEREAQVDAYAHALLLRQNLNPGKPTPKSGHWG